jgi:hypothetical protein
VLLPLLLVTDLVVHTGLSTNQEAAVAFDTEHELDAKAFPVSGCGETPMEIRQSELPRRCCLSRLSRVAPLFGPPAGFALLLFVDWMEPRLAQVLDLALPFFGLIGLGFVAGRLIGHSERGLAWMNAFIVYVALSALFFNLVSRTPFAELANGGFVALTTARTACAFALSFVTGLAITRGNLGVSAIQGIAGAYFNIELHGARADARRWGRHRPRRQR